MSAVIGHGVNPPAGGHDHELAHDHDHHGAPHGWRRWVYATNHKDIGTMYLLFSFTMFMVGGLLALGIRTELYQVVEALCHLLITADDALRLPAAQQAESGPHVGMDDEITVIVQVLGCIAALATGTYRIAGLLRKPLIALFRRIVQAFEAAADFTPGLFFGTTGDDIHPHRALYLAAQCIRALLHSVEFLAQLIERLKPGQVIFGMFGGRGKRGVGRA